MNTEIEAVANEIRQGILDEVKKKIGEGPQVQSVRPDTEEKPKKKCGPCSCIGLLVPVLLILYILMFVSVLRHVYSCCYIKANSCIIIVTMLILATVVLVLSAVYALRLKAQCLEAEKENGKKEEKKDKVQKTYKEIAAEKVQEAILDKVVKDTVDAFEKRIC